MGKSTWTDEQINRLKELYMQNYTIKDIAKELNKTDESIKAKILYCGLDKLNVRKNSVHFKAVYQDYN